MSILRKRGIQYSHLTPARYAQALQVDARGAESGRLVDTLIIGAIIQARSGERVVSLPAVEQAQSQRG